MIILKEVTGNMKTLLNAALIATTPNQSAKNTY
jgi:hypothetical protein